MSSMIFYLARKFCILLGSLFLVATLTFFLMHAAPGDPFAEEQALPQEVLDALHKHYHLDKPILVQYGYYLKGLVKGDLGPSLKYQGRMAVDVIKDAFPVSFLLGMEAIFLATASGVALGSLAALYRGKWQDRLTMLIAALGISLPSFLMATFLQYILAIKFDIFPVARWGTPMHTILPALSLAALPMAFIARLTRSTMIEVLAQEFVLTARSKGLSERKIFFRHILRTSILPVITYLGPLTASVLTGSFVVEKIFGIPGLGQWFVQSVSNRDYTLIMALTIFYSAILMACVFIVDVVYCFLDPRIMWTNSKFAYRRLWRKKNLL